MAESITITPENFKSSYGEGTFTVSEVEFAYSGACYTSKGTPTGFAKQQFIQFRKQSSGAGELKNNTSMTLKSIAIATQNDKPFTLSVGTKADELSAAGDPVKTTGKYACKDNNDADIETDVTIYTFDVEGKNFFDFLNGANAQYVAYITIELGEGGVTPPEPACKWDEIAFLGNGSGVAAYTDRFKVCAGDPAPSSIVNIQKPGWADEPGIYVTFPSAAFGAISLDASQYAQDGAGLVLYVSAFLYDAETEVTIVCQEVTYTVTVRNANPEVAPVVKKTCAEVYELADNAEATLNDVTVTYASGANVWVKDASGALLVYLPNGVENSFKAGDVLAGVAGAKATYKGLVELKPADAAAVAAIVATAGVAPAPEELTAIDADKDMSKLVLLKGVEADGAFAEGTASNLTITLGENTYTLRNNFKNAFTFDAEKKYDVTAIVTYFNALQLYFISAEEASTTAIDNTVVSEKAIKMFENGQLIIIKNGVKYNALGSVIE